MAFRIITGLVITVVCLAVAGRRFWWLSRLIRSGQVAPRRWQGLKKATGPPSISPFPQDVLDFEALLLLGDGWKGNHLPLALLPDVPDQVA